MNQNQPIIFLLACTVCVLLFGLTGFANAQQETDTKPKPAPAPAPAPIDNNVLDEAQWKKVDQSVDRGLTWLASEQQEDGSFPSIEAGQPAVTSLSLIHI